MNPLSKGVCRLCRSAFRADKPATWYNAGMLVVLCGMRSACNEANEALSLHIPTGVHSHDEDRFLSCSQARQGWCFDHAKYVQGKC